VLPSALTWTMPLLARSPMLIEYRPTDVRVTVFWKPWELP